MWRWLRNPFGRRPTRRTLLISALIVQAVVLAVGWFGTFRIVQRSFAGVIKQTILDQNRDFATRIASLLPETMGHIEYGGEDWEKLQRVIEDGTLANLPEGGFACLIEPNGQLLCHPEIRENPGLRNFSFERKRLIAGLDHGAQSQAITAAGDMDEPAAGIVEFLAGDFHYVATQPINETGLRLLVHQPVDEVVRTSREATRWIWLIAAPAAVGVLSITGLGLVSLLRRYEGTQERLNRQLHDNLLVARRIQEATLPATLPKIDGFDFAGRSTPAEETGGDTFDVFALPDRDGSPRVAMLLADATGHGIGPALAVTQLQAMCRVAWPHEGGPLAIAGILHENLRDRLPDGRFVTGWFGELDAQRGSITMVSAAQDPQLVYRRATGAIERLPTDTFPLGLVDALDADGERCVALEPGDVLLLVSDGISEAANERGEMFGIERLSQVLADTSERDAAAIVDAVDAAVRRFTNDAPADDDRTILVIRRSR
ncbi:MAG: PP2C family protein-serine/threonine phosphatase [Planctomycetota bacterium]